MDIPYEILITAYWRPQDAQLKTLYKSSNMGDLKEYQRLKDLWKKREVWTNFCLELLLLATPESVLSEVFNSLIGRCYLGPARSHTLEKMKSLEKWIGVPDFILMDQNNSIVVGEIKIGATKSNHKYSYQQYEKYMLLSTLFLMSENFEYPKNIIHMVILPSEKMEVNTNDYSDWMPEIKSNTLIPFEKHPKRDKLRKQLHERVKEFLIYKDISKDNNINLGNIVDQISATQDKITTHVFSWANFLDVYKNVVKKNKDNRTMSFVERLNELTSNY